MFRFIVALFKLVLALPLLPFVFILWICVGVSRWLAFFTPSARSKIGGPKFEGSWAIVVGSTRGLGLEYARHLGQAGFNVIVTSRSKERAQEAASKLQSFCQRKDVKFEGVALDLTDVHTVQEAIPTLFGDRDVSCVVLSYSVEVLGSPLSDQAAIVNMLTANTVSFSCLATTAFEHMKKRDGPSLLLGCSAISTFMRVMESESYCASRDFQSGIIGLLGLRATKEKPQMIVSNVETSVVWTETLVRSAKEYHGEVKSLKVLADLKKVAWNTEAFTRDVLRQAFAGNSYILLGKTFWISRAIHRFGHTLTFPPPPTPEERDGDAPTRASRRISIVVS